jgi:hypothetical protein
LRAEKEFQLSTINTSEAKSRSIFTTGFENFLFLHSLGRLLPNAVQQGVRLLLRH